MQSGKEFQVLARGQFRIQEEIVAEYADDGAQAGAVGSRVVRAVADTTAAWTQQRRQHGHHGGLAGAVRAEQADDSASWRREGDARERPAASEVAGDLLDR